MKLPKPGSIVIITILGKSQEHTVSGYNYGLSGQPTSVFFEGIEQQRYPLDVLDGCDVVYEPIEEEEDPE